MAVIICPHPRECNSCRHFRFDEDRGEKVCWAVYDKEKAVGCYSCETYKTSICPKSYTNEAVFCEKFNHKKM